MARAVHLGEATPADEGVAVQVGWALTEEDLPETRRITHDALLALMGDRRTGGVRWLTFAGAEAVAQLDRMYDLRPAGRPEADEDLANYARMRTALVERGGFLVVATAQGRM